MNQWRALLQALEKMRPRRRRVHGADGLRGLLRATVRGPCWRRFSMAVVMKKTIHHLRAHPRLVGSMAVGAVLALLLPTHIDGTTRALLGWNAAVWLYLALSTVMMRRVDHERFRRMVVAQAEGASTVLAVVLVATVASMVGIVFELTAAKLPGVRHATPHIVFALTTVVGSWLLLPTLFTLNYASAYYRTGHGSGLVFPDPDPAFAPHYVDFLYFSFTVAVASQTADVAVSSTAMRRLVLAQSVLSFAFNTAILALTINIAASLF